MHRRRPKRSRGFTLVELLVVILILGLLVGLVAPRFFGGVEKAKQEAARLQMAHFKTAIAGYMLDTGSLPQSLQDLLVTPGTEAAGKWDGPYLQDTTVIPVDPWGRPFDYRVPGNEGRDYEIISYGADGLPGGEGKNQDILSWKTE